MCYDRHIDKDILKEEYKVSPPQSRFQRPAVNKCQKAALYIFEL